MKMKETASITENSQSQNKKERIFRVRSRLRAGPVVVIKDVKGGGSSGGTC